MGYRKAKSIRTKHSKTVLADASVWFVKLPASGQIMKRS